MIVPTVIGLLYPRITCSVDSSVHYIFNFFLFFPLSVSGKLMRNIKSWLIPGVIRLLSATNCSLEWWTMMKEQMFFNR